MPRVENRDWFIYTLSDGITGAVRYVGWTVDMVVRLRAHINEARRGKVISHKNAWIRSQFEAGTRPVMTEIERGHGPGWQEREIHWIAFYKAQGCDLVNGTDGGDGLLGHEHSRETRAKIAKGNLGKVKGPLSEEHKRAISLAGKGKPKPESMRLALSKTKTGQRWNEAHRIAAANRPALTQEQRETMSKAQRGKKRSDEHRLAQSIATRGKPKTEKNIAGITATHHAKSLERISKETVLAIRDELLSIRAMHNGKCPNGTTKMLMDKYHVLAWDIGAIGSGSHWLVRQGPRKKRNKTYAK